MGYCSNCNAPKKDTDWYIHKNYNNKLKGKCLRCGCSLSVNLSNNTPTISELKDLATRARRKFDKPSGNCLKISTYILSALHERGVPADVEKVQVNGQKHYEVRVVINDNIYRLDGSRDQFKGFNNEVLVEIVN